MADDWFDKVVKENLVYDESTGQLLFSDKMGRKAGKVADKKTTNGYLVVRFQVCGVRRAVCSHRAVWFLVNGVWPEDELDHIDKVRDNNLLSNLRECSRAQNMVRVVGKKRNLPRGVCWAGHTNSKNPYMAQMGCKYLGYFSTPEAAHSAYLAEFNSKYTAEWKEF